MKSAHFTIAIALAFVATISESAWAHHYERESLSCALSATRESFDAPPTALPVSIRIKIKAAFIEGDDLKPVDWSWDLSPRDEAVRKQLIPVLRPKKLRHVGVFYKLSFGRLTPDKMTTLFTVLNGGKLDSDLATLLKNHGSSETFDVISTSWVRGEGWKDAWLFYNPASTQSIQIHPEIPMMNALSGLSVHLSMHCAPEGSVGDFLPPPGAMATVEEARQVKQVGSIMQERRGEGRLGAGASRQVF